MVKKITKAQWALKRKMNAGYIKDGKRFVLDWSGAKTKRIEVEVIGMRKAN